LVRAVSQLVLAALPIAADAQTEVYRNRQFGFMAPIPHGLYLFRPHEMNKRFWEYPFLVLASD
jgi:hypothetical protein